ncbi:MAG: hypothetical protein AAF518_13940 [Spirochaetota bacterium]
MWNAKFMKKILQFVAALLLLSACSTIKIYDEAIIPEDKAYIVYKGHTGRVNELAVSPDGKFFVSAGSDGKVKLWNFKSDHSQKILDYTHVDCLAISPDNKYIVTTQQKKELVR